MNKCSAVKRTFDLLVAVSAILALSPLLVGIGLLVWFFLGRPVIFCQMRPGLNGQPFKIYKFRTLTEDRDSHGCLLPDAERLTGFGKFLRGSSLDELPELVNIIKGDMSLVGPRPLLMEYLDRYTPEQARRHEIHPGITGWAQINGRNAIHWEEKFRLDVWYVDNGSLWLDMKILWLTFVKVFKREGINQEGQATVGKFMGTHAVRNEGGEAK